MKTTEAQFEVRSDGSHNPWAAFDTPFHDFVDMSCFEAANPHYMSPPAESDQLPTSFIIGDEVNGIYNPKSTTLQPQDPMQLTFDGADFTGLPYSLGNNISAGTFKAPVSDPTDLELGNYPAENVAGIAMPEDLPMDEPNQRMYHTMGNLSNQTFMSATSSSDEEPSLMTPPEKPSPIQMPTQDSFDRRGSATGGLATDFHSFHLQSRKSSQALYDDTSNAGSGRVSPAASVNQWVNASPPSAARQDSTLPSLSSRIDLAARRKRPRPAPLVRPDATQRCHSFGAPLTSSPRSRQMLLDPSHPVRRVRSGLDVMHGRIQKPSSTSAQLSPRVLENQFQGTLPRYRSPSRCNSAAYQQTPLTPLSAAQAGECTMDFPAHHPEDGTAQPGIPGNYESFDFNSPPITPYQFEQFPQFATQPVQRMYPSEASVIHEPPQSAPPQKTSFFLNDSPPMQNTNLSQLSWQLPAEVPSNSFQSPSAVVTAQAQYNGLPTQFEQPQIPFAYQPSALQQPPQLQIPFQCHPPQVFQGSPDHLYAARSQYPLQVCQSTPLSAYQQSMFESQAAPQPLEIKVELGPSPQGTPQPRKEYTFSNSTPDDFSPPKDEAQR